MPAHAPAKKKNGPRPVYGSLGRPARVAKDERRGVFVPPGDNPSTFMTGIDGVGEATGRWSRVLCQQVCTMAFIYTAVAYWWQQKQRHHTPGYELTSLGAMVLFVAVCYRTLPYNVAGVPLLGRVLTPRVVERAGLGGALTMVVGVIMTYTVELDGAKGKAQDTMMRAAAEDEGTALLLGGGTNGGNVWVGVGMAATVAVLLFQTMVTTQRRAKEKKL